MKALIGNLFTNSPSIDFVCEIYEHDTITDSEGNQDTKSIYINSEFDHLNILSSRDVSGVLNFNYEGYSYAYLDIEVEVNFADTISYDDYITKKKNLKKKKKLNIIMVVILPDSEKTGKFLDLDLQKAFLLIPIMPKIVF